MDFCRIFTNKINILLYFFKKFNNFIKICHIFHFSALYIYIKYKFLLWPSQYENGGIFMKDLTVYYCPECGRYTFSQPSENMVCPICNLSMVLLTRYSDFFALTKEERDRLLLQNMIAGNPSISSRFLDYMRTCSASKADAPQDPYLHKLESENKELNNTIQWMHKTIWELLQKNKALEFELENHLLSHHSQDHFESDRII
jgi:hypothetical protein